MAFQIPPQAFLSFSKKQIADSLWRLLRQMEQTDFKTPDWKANAVAFHQYVAILKKHESQQIQALGDQLQQTLPEDLRTLENCLILLERFLEKDLREDQFLISTEDTPLEKVQPKVKEKQAEIVLVLDNLRSAFNVGSLFRSAEAFGVKKIHLCGYTATPENSKTAKAALGTDHWVSYEYHENTLNCLESLKSEDYFIYALETVDESVDLSELKSDQKKMAIILGNERYGLSESVLKRADSIVSIPLIGRKNSLNVGVCGAISLYHFLSRGLTTNTSQGA